MEEKVLTVPEQTQNYFNRCRDCDEDCRFVIHKLECFLFDPEQGYCPYLSGELK